jgi:ParB family chromosome partitioning protein
MSATTIHSTDTTTKARFLAPGTHQRADAKGKGKGQGAMPARGPTKTTKGRATEPTASAEDEAFAAGDLVLIPLSRLVPSAFNVRKSGGEDVGELAALIKALGLLQNLVVHPADEGFWAVCAGSRRLAALQHNRDAGLIAADHKVNCVVVDVADALQVSLAENYAREAMNPADEARAFADLVDDLAFEWF